MDDFTLVPSNIASIHGFEESDLTLGGRGALVAKARASATTVEAVVLTENAYVRSGPGDANPRLAEIHEGLKVRVLSEREGWYQVTLANGLTGWLRNTEIEAI